LDIIGVTGSKGKTTTAQAITTILKELWPQVQAVGVDGISPLGKLKEITSRTMVIFELSSWRLEALMAKKISPPVAVVTSIYRDHLNTYDSWDDYIATKKSIWQHQGGGDIVILNADDAVIKTWEKEVPSHLWWYAMNYVPDGNAIFVRNGNIVIRQEGQEVTVMAVDALVVQAEHERRNVLPGILLAYLRGMAIERLRVVAKKVVGLPHRLEMVREINGVKYINDSTATMPDATIKALQAYQGTPIVHIAGGSDKALLFEELAAAEAASSVRAIVWLPGSATERMQADFAKAGVKARMANATSMEEAVAMAAKLAQPGEIVLLSPGATSFGLFVHEFDRGDKFRQAVMGLK
jgi:UDP-N-acetylmuramoylalanine--D-glutamate ligase